MYEVVLKRFENPDDVRTFEKGKFELVQVGGMTIGRATYQPGWKWSLHVGKAADAKSCMVEHVGMVVSGRATAAMDDGWVIEMKAGDPSLLHPGTIVGWLATSLMCRCTLWARINMRSRRSKLRICHGFSRIDTDKPREIGPVWTAGASLTGVRGLCNTDNDYEFGEPGWRNWQTQRT